MGRLATMVDVVDKALRIVGALCLVALTVLVVVQVFMRYGLGGVPAFTEEISRYAMIWMALLGSAVAVREASHIRIDLVPTILGATAPLIGRVLEVLIDLVALTVFLVLVWQGIDMVIFAHGQRSEGLQVSLAYPYASVPVAFGFAAFFAVSRFIVRSDRGE